MSCSMADHECKCVLCSKSLLQAYERDGLVDRIKTDTLIRLSDELQLVGVKLNIDSLARHVLCRSFTTKIKCAVHCIQNLTHLKKDIQNTLAIHIPASTRISHKRQLSANCNAHWHNKENSCSQLPKQLSSHEPNASQQAPIMARGENMLYLIKNF